MQQSGLSQRPGLFKIPVCLCASVFAFCEPALPEDSEALEPLKRHCQLGEVSEAGSSSETFPGVFTCSFTAVHTLECFILFGSKP